MTRPTTITDPLVPLDRMDPRRLGLLRRMAETAPGDARSRQLDDEYRVEYGRYSLRRRPEGRWEATWHEPALGAEFTAYLAAHPDEAHPDWRD